MTIDDLKSQLGEEVYSEACREAWQSAAGTGSMGSRHNRGLRPALDAVLSELDFDAGAGERDDAFIAFFAALYREMPCYGLLSQLFITRSYERIDVNGRLQFWEFARTMLSAEEDALADPVGYYMWCHFFEDQWVEDAWKALTVGAPDRLLERVLVNSGPVPFRIKRELYAQKIGNKRWHYFIYKGLLGSAFDVYGKIDRTEASRMLGRLKPALSKEERGDWERLVAKLQPDA